MAETESQDISFLYPHLFAADQTIVDVNANLTRILRVVEEAIAMAEQHAPHLPELPLLRERRRRLRRFQHAVLNVSEYFQTELVALEDGYAKRSGVSL